MFQLPSPTCQNLAQKPQSRSASCGSIQGEEAQPSASPAQPSQVCGGSWGSWDLKGMFRLVSFRQAHSLAAGIYIYIYIIYITKIDRHLSSRIQGGQSKPTQKSVLTILFHQKPTRFLCTQATIAFMTSSSLPLILIISSWQKSTP